MKRLLIALVAFMSTCLPYQSLKASTLVGGPDGCGSCCPCDPCGPCGPCGPCDSCCCNCFDGFYIGGHVGWAFRDHFFTNRTGVAAVLTADLPFGTVVTRDDGVEGGFQIGYNWTCCCNTLLGVELDWNWTDHCRSHRFRNFDTVVTDFTEINLHNRHHWFGTIRGRAGIITPCNLLLYTTLGVAYAHHHERFRVTDSLLLLGTDGDGNRHCHTDWGIAVGFGAEYCINCWINVRAEALLLKFQDRERNFGSSVAILAPFDFRFDFFSTVWLARVGINFNLSNWCCCW